MRKAIFLDRDGTLIKGIKRPRLTSGITAPWLLKEIEFEPRVVEAVTKFHSLGYITVMATNQSDPANGFLDYDLWERIFQKVAQKVKLDDYFYCPHPREVGCHCKKPKPGMLTDAANKWNIDLKNSYMIGDTDADTGAGKAAGCTTILIRRDYNQNVQADIVVKSLWEATTKV